MSCYTIEATPHTVLVCRYYVLLCGAVKVSELNRRGDLLVTYGHTWVHGDTHVDCEDFETGERISLEIKRGALLFSIKRSLKLKKVYR